MPRCAFKEGCYVNLKSDMTLTNRNLMLEILGQGPYLVLKTELYEERWLATIKTDNNINQKIWIDSIEREDMSDFEKMQIISTIFQGLCACEVNANINYEKLIQRAKDLYEELLKFI